ncbi:MAG: hypothetical protein M3R38_18700 [Actinomycetota bacterium]|nr:hypothetical protein [Actinomycetota bacterium]
MTENTRPRSSTSIEAQIASDEDLRCGVHELRKVYDDVDECARNAPVENGNVEDDYWREAVDAAERRYESVAEIINKRVLGQVQEWMQEVHEQKALVLALATSGVDVRDGWGEDDTKRLMATGLVPREMVEVLEIVLMELDGTVAYRQRVRPDFVPEGEVKGTEIHGLTLKELAREPGFQEIARDFARAALGRRVVSYNAPWAAKVLAAECERQHQHNPLADLSIDDCVMAQRSRYAGKYLVSLPGYKQLKLGARDTTPMGVARTVCDVVEAYRTGDARFPPERPYDPPKRAQVDEEREHEWGWRDAQKPGDFEYPWERDAREEREKKERDEEFANSLRAIGITDEAEIARKIEEKEREAEADWEDIPF